MILVEKIHAERIARVRTALESCGLTQMIVCDPKSVWYLTGVAVEPYERLLALYHDPAPFSMRQIVLAPCSPFSVSPELLRQSAVLARQSPNI